jgi:hypothetical protein
MKLFADTDSTESHFFCATCLTWARTLRRVGNNIENVLPIFTAVVFLFHRTCAGLVFPHRTAQRRLSLSIQRRSVSTATPVSYLYATASRRSAFSLHCYNCTKLPTFITLFQPHFLRCQREYFFFCSSRCRKASVVHRTSREPVRS